MHSACQPKPSSRYAMISGGCSCLVYTLFSSKDDNIVTIASIRIVQLVRLWIFEAKYLSQRILIT